MTGLCRTGKTAYADQVAAEEAFASIWADNEVAGVIRREPTRAYACDYCRDWHLTSKAPRKGRSS